MKYPLFLALRYLRTRKVCALAVLAIALSIGTILTVLYVLWGLSAEMERQARGAQPDLAVRFPSPYGLTGYGELLEELKGIDGVAAASPVLEHWVLIERGQTHTPALLLGIDPEAERKVVGLDRWFASRDPGLSAAEGDLPSHAALGEDLSIAAGMLPGDEGVLVSAILSSPSSPAPTYPTMGRAPFVLASTFRTWDYPVDRYTVLLPLSEAQRILRRYQPAAVSGIRLKLHPNAPASTAEAVRAAASAREPGAVVETWRERSAYLIAMVDAENRVMFVILSFILVAVCVSIAVILSTMVREKTRDIGVLKSMGATTAGVARLFLLAGGAIGLAGATAGVALSLCAEANIEWIDRRLQDLFGYDFAGGYHLERMPTHVDPQAVALMWGLAVAVSLLASLVPAFRAARQDAVRALRYE